MSVLVVVQGSPNPEKNDILLQYQQVARTIIGKHGGQVVARGSGIGTLHGPNKWNVGIIIRFPDEAAVRAWYNDPDYQKVIPLRDQAYGHGNLEITMFQE
ncbi:MAG: DUF1330 domain-containing protein [Candidatus Binatia bacterium]